MKFGPDGRLHAINPEAGFFGVAPGTSLDSNPNAIGTLSRNSIFTNCALTLDGDVWWEDMTAAPPRGLTDWLRRPWTPGCGRKASHPNARFTTPARQCPVIDPAWEDPQGVPISAFIFGGRRASVVPLVTEALSWNHGVFLASTLASEMTAAASGTIGMLRRDPFAMLPFCGYHLGDYFAHWLKIGALAPAEKLPRIYYVNWFRKSSSGYLLWPGYGHNGRVLKWIFERVCGNGQAVESPIGRQPAAGALDLTGLNLSAEKVSEALRVEPDEWRREVPLIREYYGSLGPRLPGALHAELDALEKRLQA
jgi:phosphoenolpyruvate carboxykinase (GTP)